MKAHIVGSATVTLLVMAQRTVWAQAQPGGEALPA